MASSLHPTRLRASATQSLRTDRRPALLRVGLGLTATCCVTLTALAGPASADPTPTPSGSGGAAPTFASVTAELQTVARQNEQVAERLNAAKIDLTAKQTQAKRAQTSAATAQTQWKAALQQYGSTIVDQYKTGSLNGAGALLTSDGAQNYLDTLTALNTVSRYNSSVVEQLSVAKQKAEAATSAANKAVADATTLKDQLTTQKADLDKRAAEYKTLLASLTPQQQVTFKAQDTAPVPANYTVHAGSSAAQTAIDFALAQQGKPYVFGAGGPGSYDCSGLTAAAYAAAGVSLPHSAAGQYDYGTHVSLSELQPGDLVFWYSPIGHVAIYLGNGMIVHAPTSGDVVKVSPMFDGAIGATRLT